LIRSSLTQWKGCENVTIDGHSQYCEWLSLEKFLLPFRIVNGLNETSLFEKKIFDVILFRAS